MDTSDDTHLPSGEPEQQQEQCEVHNHNDKHDHHNNHNEEDNDDADMDPEGGHGVLLADSFFADKAEVIKGIAGLLDPAAGDGSALLPAVEDLLMKYQEIPSLLNSSMKDLCEPVAEGLLRALEGDIPLLDRVSKLFYLFCRIRGYKNMIKFLPNGVNYLEPCLRLLKREEIKQHSRWETRYTLLLWMRILSLIPFSIDSIDSSVFRGVNLTQAIQEVCFECFHEAGPVRDIAAYCLATLLTRPDMESHYLKSFLELATTILQNWSSSSGGGQGAKYFELIGVLSCLCQIYKFGHRDKVLQFAGGVLEAVYPLMEGGQTPQQKVRKYISKLIQRVGLAFLPPRVAAWRYQRGRRNLLGVSDASSNATVEMESGEDEDDFDVPEELDGIFERLLAILSDSDTVVRWSAAKGIGRLTMRLPKNYADDIIGEIIKNFDDEDDDSAWHGSCLVIAELARRGLLLPSYLQVVIDAIEKALIYDKMRGFHSTGSHVRDSACYVCWACARAYTGSVLKPYTASLTKRMLATFLFDREINCRRAASAAYQESVGRLGADNFPFGLEIMAIADYFSVGNITNCYIHLAPKIASMAPEFMEILFFDLFNHRLSHWDENIRKLASQSMGRLATINPAIAIRTLDDLAKQCLSNESLERHGALLGISEILRAVFNVKTGELNIDKLSTRDPIIRSHFTPALWEEIINIVPQMSKSRMFRGKGGDLLRNAAAYLIESLAVIGTPLSWKTRTTFFDFLIENIRQPFDHIQEASVDALRTLLYHSVVTYAIDCAKVSPLTLSKFVSGVTTEQNVAVTRGYALALSSLPYKLLESNVEEFSNVVACLSKISDPSHLIAGEADPETRKNAIRACSIVLTLIIDNGAIHVKFIKELWEILLRSCDDYSIDKRGDTGSWCRTAALGGLDSALHSALKNIQKSEGMESNLTSTGEPFAEFSSSCEVFRGIFGANSLTESTIFESMVTQVMMQLLKQMGEKIDSVRDLCGNIFQKVIMNPGFQSKSLTPNRDLILSSLFACEQKNRDPFAPADVAITLHWSKPKISFQFLSSLLQEGIFVAPIIAGIVSTVGGSLGSMSTTAEKDIGYALRRLSESNASAMQVAVSSLNHAVNHFAGNDTFLIPVMRTLDIFMKNDVLNVANCDVRDVIVPALKSNLYNSKNYQLIKVCIDVICDIMFWEEVLREELIDLSICVLGHKYPKIRKYAAEALYLLFMNEYFTNRYSSTDLDQVSNWLVECPWEGEISAARNMREQICTKLNRTLPAAPAPVAGVSTKKSTSRKPKDELDSYSSLVRDAGY